MKLIVALLAVAGFAAAADVKLGKPLSTSEPVAIATVLAGPGEYVGKTIQVKGKIAAVCQMMGCWMDLTNDAGQKLHIKVKDGEIVFPKDASGKLAIAEGKLAKLELTKEQAVARAEEEAKEQGRKFDPASIKSGVTTYQLEGTGAVILGN